MITWKCHVCGETRPDDRISVYSRHAMLGGRFPYKENVRYCNDNPACVAGAREVRFIKEGSDG